MSVASELEKLSANIENAYTAIENKGGTFVEKTARQLSAAIDTIQTGGGDENYYGIGIDDLMKPLNPDASTFSYSRSEKTDISMLLSTDADSNGTIDIPGLFAYNDDIKHFTMVLSAEGNGSQLFSPISMRATFLSCKGLNDVKILTDNCNLRARYKASMQQAFEESTLSSATFDFTDTATAQTYHFYRTFYNCTNLTKIEFPKLTAIGGNYAFYSAFYNCTKLSSITFPEVQSITQSSTFRQAISPATTAGCEVHFPKLTTLNRASSSANSTFYYCNNMTKIYFNSLQSIGGSSSNTYVFGTCTSLSEIHFKSTAKAAIEADVGYATLWGRGAGNATVYFDL